MIRKSMGVGAKKKNCRAPLQGCKTRGEGRAAEKMNGERESEERVREGRIREKEWKGRAEERTKVGSGTKTSELQSVPEESQIPQRAIKVGPGETTRTGTDGRNER